MQEDASSSHEDGEDNGETEQEAASKKPAGAAPLAPPITALQYPAKYKPVLLLGPYDTRGHYKNVGTGKRKRATHKISCPTRIKVVCRNRDGCKWFIDPRCKPHNHDLNPVPPAPVPPPRHHH